MSKKLSKKKIVVYVLVVLAVGAVASLVYVQTRNEPTKQAPTTYSGPSQQDIKDAEDNKGRVQQRREVEDQASSATGVSSVSPQITSVSQNGQEIVVNAYVPGVFEDGGECKAVFTRGSSEVSKTVQAFADATTTSCSPIRVDRSEFNTASTWVVTVSYNSKSAQGVSEVKLLVIQ